MPKQKTQQLSWPIGRRVIIIGGKSGFNYVSIHTFRQAAAKENNKSQKKTKKNKITKVNSNRAENLTNNLCYESVTPLQ